MNLLPSSTCATCRFIGYTRRPGEQPTNLTCANSETAQTREIHESVLSGSQDIKVSSVIFDHMPFVPPSLAFACNRYAERAPDLGMIPTHLRD